MESKKAILELTNSASTYGTLMRAFHNDKNMNHYFGINDFVDYQIEGQFLRYVQPPIHEVIRVDIKKVNTIRIWISSLNTNDQIFTAVIIDIFKDYLSKICIVDVAKNNPKSNTKSDMAEWHSQKELIELQRYEKKISDRDIVFYKELLSYYEKRNEMTESLIMVNRYKIYELGISTIKDFILDHMNGIYRISHVIGIVMSSEFEEKEGWVFGDNVIYKFIIDLINDGRIMIHSSYHEDYSKGPLIYKKGAN